MARHDHIDRFIDLLKWPAALIAVAMLPGLAIAVLGLAANIVDRPASMIPLVAGFVVYAAIRNWMLRGVGWGTFFSTFEHELTHAIFAWLTLHRVTNFRATIRKGGYITIRGRGNWLITIAPYFFPTLCVPIAAGLVFVPIDWLVWTTALLGAAIGVHVFSTMTETHAGQTDLQRVGFFFAAMFLPAANVLCLGMVIAFAHGGLPVAGAFAHDAFVTSWRWWHSLL